MLVVPDALLSAQSVTSPPLVIKFLPSAKVILFVPRSRISPLAAPPVVSILSLIVMLPPYIETGPETVMVSDKVISEVLVVEPKVIPVRLGSITREERLGEIENESLSRSG